MFDIGWSELLVIGVVALIVVGPKDLPIMFRRLGEFTAKARGMAREFRRAMEQAADEAGVKDVSRDLRNMTSPKNLGLDKLRSATKDMASLDPKGGGPATRKLSEERAEKAAKVREATARAATERKAAEAAAAGGPAEAAKPAEAGAAEGAKTDG